MLVCSFSTFRLLLVIAGEKMTQDIKERGQTQRVDPIHEEQFFKTKSGFLLDNCMEITISVYSFRAGMGQRCILAFFLILCYHELMRYFENIAGTAVLNCCDTANK